MTKTKSLSLYTVLFAAVAFLGVTLWGSRVAAQGDEPRNVIFILSDDHRYDFLGAMDKPSFLETPNMDRMIREGAHLQNAFVSTSLCSPSRASILTGQYAHRHGVVDNQRPVPEGTVFFPERLQEVGYETAFIGKWHMGHANAEPRPGFDYWLSFRGQGEYFDPTFNINGEEVQEEGYITDLLGTRALEWLQQDQDEPFFLYLSFKAPHYPFTPAPRNDDRYADAEVEYPETMANTQQNYESQPDWVRERRYSIHGVNHMIQGRFDNDPVPDFEEFYRNYTEAVYGIDENIGRVLDYLEESGLAENTLVIYMGDNGFALGEHGFYDKRDAFEESIRVPLIAYAPGMIEPGTKVTEMVQNIDIGPTILDLAGASYPEGKTIDGRSFLPLLRGEQVDWRDEILYEYYWEWNFPMTPSLFALRTDRYKYVFYHGHWDKNSLHDLKTDPLERHNLINVPKYQEKVERMRDRLFDKLETTNGMQIPLRRPQGERLDQRKLKK